MRKKIPTFFRTFFEVSGRSHSAENIKRGNPLEIFKKFAKVTKPKKIDQGRDSNPRPPAWRNPKNLNTSMPSASRSSSLVLQLVLVGASL